jgi:hypothetical protein
MSCLESRFGEDPLALCRARGRWRASGAGADKLMLLCSLLSEYSVNDKLREIDVANEVRTDRQLRDSHLCPMAV